MTELYEKSMKKLELDAVLDRLAGCATSEEAKDRCRALRPLSDAEEIRRLLEQTTAACGMITLKGAPGFQDVREVASSLERADRGGCLTPVELLRIAGVLRCIRSVKAYYNSDSNQSVLDVYFQELSPNRYLEEKITNSILSEEEIADAASSELADIRRHMRIQSAKVKESLQKIISSPSYAKYLRDPIITLRGDRYVVPVKSEYKSEIPGLIHDVSSTGSTFFIEPMSAVNANNALRELLIREKKEIERILAELSAEAASFRESIVIGEGRLPNDDEVHQWFEGIDRKLEHEAADREVLLFNHGAMTTVLPKATERYQPDLQVRYQEILTTCNKAYADADYKYWIGRFQQAGL